MNHLLSKLFLKLGMRFQILDICEICVEDTRPFVPLPLVHRVYALLQLGTTRFIDAASIDPYPVELILNRLLTTLFNLVESSLGFWSSVLDICEYDLFVRVRTPCMR